MSPLWKLKYDLFLTEERKKYCNIATHNRCQKCMKMDSTGHFLLCSKNESHKIYENFIEHCKKIDPSLMALKLIHMDINGKSDDVYAIGWILATLTKIHYSKKICKNLSEANNLKVTLTNHASTFKFLNKERYATTLDMIKFLLQS